MNILNGHSKINKIASMGIGAMIVFIAMVLAAGISASVLVQTADRLEMQAMETGRQTMREVSTGLRITDIGGKYDTRSMAYNATTGLIQGGGPHDAWHNYSRIHNLTITITPLAGSMYVDLSSAVFELSNSTTKCILTYDSNNFQGTVGSSGLFAVDAFDLAPNKFGIIKLQDADGSCTSPNPVLNKGDMASLTVNASACFFGLDSRDSVWGAIEPEEGSLCQFSFMVPASLYDVIYDLY
jgi:archaeal flagellin FlaB